MDLTRETGDQTCAKVSHAYQQHSSVIVSPYNGMFPTPLCHGSLPRQAIGGNPAEIFGNHRLSYHAQQGGVEPFPTAII